MTGELQKIAPTLYHHPLSQPHISTPWGCEFAALSTLWICIGLMTCSPFPHLVDLYWPHDLLWPRINAEVTVRQLGAQAQRTCFPLASRLCHGHGTSWANQQEDETLWVGELSGPNQDLPWPVSLDLPVDSRHTRKPNRPQPNWSRSAEHPSRLTDLWEVTTASFLSQLVWSWFVIQHYCGGRW